MADEILLYDMARKDGNVCWSPNVWKTRLVLNYKNLPYRTEWLTHPEIKPTLQALNIPPNTSGSPYTLPTIRLPSGEYITDSQTIAERLETLHLSPPLHLSNGLHTELGPLLAKISIPLVAVFMPLIGRNIVPESAAEYFEETRSARFGMPLAQLEAERGGSTAWEAAEPGLQELEAWISKQKRDAGPFVLGSEVCYADFVIAGLMESLRRIEPGVFERFVGVRKELREVWEACRVWMEKDT